MKFVCRNKECSNYNVEYNYLSNTYKYIDGVLLSNHAECPKCGCIREEINTDDVPLSEKNIDLLRFDMCTPEQRKDILKKRSHEHFKKEIEPYKQEKINQAVNNFKEASRS